MAILRWTQTHPGWSFWLRWLAGTIGGLVLMLLLSVPLNAAAMSLPGGTDLGAPNWLGVVLMSLGWILIGATFGLGQWWALRGELEGAGWWILATTVGYPLGNLLPTVWRVTDAPLLNGLLGLLSFGLALGVLQWLVLRGRVQQAGWWILISVAGWLLVLAVTGAAYLSGLYVEPFDMLSAFLFPTAISGAGMAWLLERKIQS